MLSAYLFGIALFFSLGHLFYKKEWHAHRSLEVFISYILFFNMGIMGFLAAYAHVFMGPAIAEQIGWQPGSPFQFEIGMANLSYGVLGVLAYWIRGRFWEAAVIGWSLLLLGCFVGHLREFYIHHDTAPLNIGLFIWFNDLFLPLLLLAALFFFRKGEHR